MFLPPSHIHIPSYIQVSRCLTFLSQSKPAALAFYGRLRDHVSLGAVARLAVMLLKCVAAALHTPTSSSSSSDDDVSSFPSFVSHTYIQ